MPQINIGITVASPLLIILFLAFKPQLGNNASIAFIISFGALFLGSFILPLIFKHQADNFRSKTYFGRLLLSAKIGLGNLSDEYYQYIHTCYAIGVIAFLIGIFFSVMNLLS